MDRDGVIIENRADYVKSLNEVHFIPGVLAALAAAARLPCHLVIITNQSVIGRGLIDNDTAGLINQFVVQRVAAAGGRVDGVYVCPHTPDAGCDCRKPAPGLFRQIGDRYGIDLKDVPTAGDSLRDLQAGAAAGCEPHLLLTGMGAACRGIDPLPPEYPANTMVHESLAAFVEFLLAREAQAALQVAV